MQREARGTATHDRVDLEVLAGVAHGTAYVVSVAPEGAGSIVRLAFPFGRTVDVLVPVVPATDPAYTLERPLAVHVHGSGSDLGCSVIHRGAAGPARVEVPLPHALALAGAGVHTVVQAD